MAGDHHVFYVKTAPELRLENGMFHVCYEVGGKRIELVLRPSIFTETRRKGDRLLKEFQRHDGAVDIKDGH